MRSVCLVLVVITTVAHADERVDQAAIPDITIVEPAFPLDRFVPRDQRRSSAVGGSAGLGVGRHGDRPLIGAATLTAGHRSDNLLLGTHGELVLVGRGPAVERGRLRGLLELRSDWDAELAGILAVRGSAEHGQALLVAPARLGAGRRDHGEVVADGAVRIGSRKGDTVMIAMVRADASTTRWLAAPTLGRADRRGLGLGVGHTSFDGELPRGTIDLFRARVEHVRIERPFAAAGIGSLARAVRTVEVGLGTTDFTLHIDHELLAVIAVDLGWSWVEADTTGGPLADNAFRMRLGAALAWRDSGDRQRRRIGFAIARTPTSTPDGQRLVGEWRLELATGIESSRFLLDARGTLSWLVPFTGTSEVDTLVRYGAQLEAFAKLGAGIELGVYHARAFEPPGAGDPWASARRWDAETGALARWRR